MTKSLFNNTIYSALDKFVIILVGFVFVSLMITYIGVDLFGVYLILSMLMLTSALNILDLGLEVSVLYYISYYSDNISKRKVVAIYAILLYTLLGMFFSLIIYFLSPILAVSIKSSILSNLELVMMLQLIAINLFVQFIFISIKAVLEGARLFYFTKLINSFSILFQSIFILVVVSFTNSLEYVFEIILFISIMKLLVFIFLLHKYIIVDFNNLNLFSLRNRVLLKKIISYSYDVLSVKIIGFIYNQIDKILIWKYLTPMWMTIYEVVTKPIMPLRVIIQILNSALIPEIAKFYKNNENKKILVIYLRLVKYAYLLILPMSLLLMFYMDAVLSLWINDTYAKYGYLSVVVIVTYMILPIAAIAGTIISGLQEMKKTFIFVTIAMFLNLILSFLLLDYMGMVGLLIATLTVQIYLAFPYNNLLEKTIKLKTFVFKRVLKYLVYHLPIFILMLILKNNIDSLEIGIVGALILMFFQYTLNYQYLLSNKEKKYLKKKMEKKK